MMNMLRNLQVGVALCDQVPKVLATPCKLRLPTIEHWLKQMPQSVATECGVHDSLPVQGRPSGDAP